jgi:Tol biopolymer transport system component
MFEQTPPARFHVSAVAILAGFALLAPQRVEAQEPVPPTQEPQDTVLAAEDTVAPLGPPQPDIYLAELSVFDGLHYLGPLQNVTNRPYSYDDQPIFTPDGRSLLYTAEYASPDTVQTEIHRYYLTSRRETRITRTDGSEHSPRPVPGDRAFSAILAEADSSQRIWRFTMEGMDGEVLFRNLNAVEHHAWGSETSVLLYMFGEPPTARIADLATGESEVVASGVGRSLNKIPNRNAWSFVERVSVDEAWISEVNIATHEVRRLIRTVGGGEFHAWTPDGVLLMAFGSRIYQWDSEVDFDWRGVADLADMGITIGDIAVSPDGTRIAIVGDPIPGTGPVERE